MSNKGDYGYFGTGDSGYAHYMQAFNETTASHSYSKPVKSAKDNSDEDMLMILAMLFAPVILPLFCIRKFFEMLFS